MTSIEQSYAHRLTSRLSILAVGLFVVATNAFVIAGLLPSIAASFGVSPDQVSYSISYYALVVAVAAPALSILLPRLSRTTLMATGTALVALGTLIAAGAPGLEVFTAGRIVAALGGAALVPAATAAAAALAPVERRGRAIAYVAVGFTAASAFGAPLGTALASAGSWRLPLFALAGLAALVSIGIVLFVRGVPLGHAVSMRRRFATLADPRILLTLAAALLVFCGFNAVYIFSSAVTSGATGDSGSLLAVLLLVFGVSGVAGNVLAGRLVDRFGSRVMTAASLLLQLAALALLPFVAGSLVGTAILFAVWGASANASTLPLQHRLIEIDPATSGIALSWYSTAMYTGIALAPPLGATAFGLGGGELVPEVAAGALLLALVVFQVGWLWRRNPAGPRAVDTPIGATATSLPEPVATRRGEILSRHEH